MTDYAACVAEIQRIYNAASRYPARAEPFYTKADQQALAALTEAGLKDLVRHRFNRSEIVLIQKISACGVSGKLETITPENLTATSVGGLLALVCPLQGPFAQVSMTKNGDVVVRASAETKVAFERLQSALRIG